MSPERVLGLALLVCAVVIGIRFLYVFLASLLPNSPRRLVARRDPRLAWRLTFLVAWSGLRGAVSLAAAPRPAHRLSRAQPDPAHHVRGDPRDARRTGLTLPLVVRWSAGTASIPRATRRRSLGRRCTGSGSTRCATRGPAGRTTCRCSTGSSPASATGCSISRPTTRRRPRSVAGNTEEHEGDPALRAQRPARGRHRAARRRGDQRRDAARARTGSTSKSWMEA